MARTKKTAKAPAKKTATVKVKGFLPEIAKEVNTRLELAQQIEGKADDHRLAAALGLENAKKECKKAKVNFKKWCEANVKWKYETVRKLARIGASSNPPKALQDLREGVKKAVKKSRATKAATAADPVAVATKAISAMPDEERQDFIRSQVATSGVAVGGASTLADAKFAFDGLPADDKIKLLAYAAEKTGAQVKLFGEDVSDGGNGATKPVGRGALRRPAASRRLGRA